MERRKNILMDVTPTPKPEEPRLPTPPPPVPKPTEKEIFKQPKPHVEEEELEPLPQIPPPSAPIDIPGAKKKRECSEKMREHLARCRKLASEKKKALKASQAPKPENPPYIEPQNPVRPTTSFIPESAPPQQRPTTNMGIDYDRIISGVAGRIEERRLDDEAYTMMTNNIRREEQEKAKAQYSEYFIEAAGKFKKQMYSGYGKATIMGQNMNSKRGYSYAYDKQSANPFDKCFQ